MLLNQALLMHFQFLVSRDQALDLFIGRRFGGCLKVTIGQYQNEGKDKGKGQRSLHGYFIQNKTQEALKEINGQHYIMRIWHV